MQVELYDTIYMGVCDVYEAMWCYTYTVSDIQTMSHSLTRIIAEVYVIS